MLGIVQVFLQGSDVKSLLTSKHYPCFAKASDENNNHNLSQEDWLVQDSTTHKAV